MKHGLNFVLLSLLLWTAVALSGVAQSSAQSTPDVFNSTLKDYRIWIDPVLSISWTIPRGLYARAEQEEQWRKRVSQNAQAVNTFTAELQRRDAEDRSRGILLRGDNADPQTLGLADNSAASPRFKMPNIFTPPAVAQTFMILARPLPAQDRPINDLLQEETAKMRAQDTSLKLDFGAEPETFGGIQFVHADWKRHDRARDEEAYFRSYLASRNGYELIFTFRADSKKALEMISKSMQSISPAEDAAAK
ncbi:MAG TPA: hypothetical protein VKB56_01955 [Terriglobales bacterium]|nr:hypothetical protein [Terriglobales bacterium]